ncbi:hypothetical protein GCM10009780_75440 [Actinomadura alba]
MTRFPEDIPVLVRYLLPATDDGRRAWAWLPGIVLQRCDVDEWHVVVEVPARGGVGLGANLGIWGCR